MDCQRFSRHLGSFADGELDAADDVKVREHVDSCLSCAKEVDGIRELKSRLSGVFCEERAPDELAFRVRGGIAEAARRPSVGASWVQKLVVPLGMAAAVVFVWQVSLLIDGGADPQLGGARNAVEARWVQGVRTQHAKCTKLGPAHGGSGGPLDAGRVQVQLSAELGLPVLAPDLSGLGFVLSGADACGVNNAPAAHLVYERGRDGCLLSIFSLRRLDTLLPTDGFFAGNRGCFICAGGPSAVLAWHNSDATYLFCGKLSVLELKKLAEWSNPTR